MNKSITFILTIGSSGGSIDKFITRSKSYNEFHMLQEELAGWMNSKDALHIQCKEVTRLYNPNHVTKILFETLNDERSEKVSDDVMDVYVRTNNRVFWLYK